MASEEERRIDATPCPECGAPPDHARLASSLAAELMEARAILRWISGELSIAAGYARYAGDTAYSVLLIDLMARARTAAEGKP